ncbi:hypothetical protein CERZMDRAFT_93022 [Cercospora zeae-maydis SCOH1-5]|uniref:Uncharacterized protein n=1 Tax=Cercospora zeae-maydis SCOH1-5 TaxID=717836 RepID=A0A6A6FTZ2_9PEZI|nr:hypothetical protein CERZMDRAFT_93022 [Cercospora zeae-maydis SCOH1-5]
MAFLKRLSDSLWDYVSPQKQTNTTLPSPRTDIPATPTRKHSPGDLAKFSRSMSPIERVSEWQYNAASSPRSTKRKRLHTPESNSGRRVKQPKIELEDTDYSPESDERGRLGSPMREDYDERTSFLRTPSRRSNTRSPSPSFEEYIRDEDELSADLRVDDEQFNDTPPKKRVVHIPAELSSKHISTEELRAKGWDDDYITLMQRIGLRGREPILPAYMKFEYRFLPDGLFHSNDEEAFISSLRNSHFKASKALQRLLDLGGHIRDRQEVDPQNARPELEVKRHLKDYMKWAQADGVLDKQTAIPVLVQVYAEAGTPGEDMTAMAEDKCRALVQKWKKALEVARSVELSPVSRASDATILSYEIPTVYAILASDAIVAIMAYTVESDKCQPMALFDYNLKDYDVWNSLALAILVCHVRNVQLRIAEDTDIGMKQPNSSESSCSVDEDA